MKKRLSILTLLFLPLFTVSAAEREMSVVLSSNYVFRGVTQTADQAAVQANYKLSQYHDSGWYVGGFASNYLKGLEVDVFGGLNAAFGRNDAFVVDVGAVEYMYTDSSFLFSHEFYLGLTYEDYTYIKYFFGENNNRYLDLGITFEVLYNMNLDLHFGESFGGAKNINDISASLRKDFDSFSLSGTMTYEDDNKNTEAFFTLLIDF